MPLFGRGEWEQGEVDRAIREEQVFLEMPEAPPLYQHALKGGRDLAIQAARNVGMLETSIGHFETFGLNCDRYLESRELPFVANDRGVLSRERTLADAGRLACLKRHFAHMVLQLGVDVALTLGAVRAGWSKERTGEVGSPRWNMAPLVVGSTGTRMVFDHVKKPNWFAWTKVVLHTGHTTMAMPDEGRDNADETLERLFPKSASGLSTQAPDLCECGCAVRFVPTL